MKEQTRCAGEGGAGGPGLGAEAKTSDFKGPCEDLVQAMSNLCSLISLFCPPLIAHVGNVSIEQKTFFGPRDKLGIACAISLPPTLYLSIYLEVKVSSASNPFPLCPGIFSPLCVSPSFSFSPCSVFSRVTFRWKETPQRSVFSPGNPCRLDSRGEEGEGKT